jgi:phosphoribosyl-ATP pyrophosphohydrolase/phosphoribosyl-AMP cyclohydrolase/histidinol dehydrogenase
LLLFKFTLRLMFVSGVTLADVERELDRRALKVQRRPGNAKPHIVSMLQEQDQAKQLKQAEQNKQTPVHAKEDSPRSPHPEKPLHIEVPSPKSLVKLALPKGRMEAGK